MSRYLRRFKNDEEKSLQGMVESRDPEIIYTILEAIFYGIDRKMDTVECFEIESPSSIVTFKMPRPEWLGCLTKCIDDMIDLEDYEMCSTIQKYLKKLSQKKIGN